MNAIIAVNPQQMQEAQATTVGWIAAKLADAQKEHALALETFEGLHKLGAKTKPAELMAQRARRRVKFYEKMKAALDAGFYIIPPFNIQLFAVRTDRASPDEISTSRWPKEQEGRTLPIGEGSYVNPAVTRSEYGKRFDGKNADNSDRFVTIYRNDAWANQIDMPVRAMKPQIIEAVGRALELKIFDALGIAPAYRAADPIIAGQIRRPDGKGVITFFVAWWLEAEDL